MGRWYGAAAMTEEAEEADAQLAVEESLKPSPRDREQAPTEGTNRPSPQSTTSADSSDGARPSVSRTRPEAGRLGPRGVSSDGCVPTRARGGCSSGSAIYVACLVVFAILAGDRLVEAHPLQPLRAARRRLAPWAAPSPGSPPSYAGMNDFALYEGKWFISFPPVPGHPDDAARLALGEPRELPRRAVHRLARRASARRCSSSSSRSSGAPGARRAPRSRTSGSRSSSRSAPSTSSRPSKAPSGSRPMSSASGSPRCSCSSRSTRRTRHSPARCSAACSSRERRRCSSASSSSRGDPRALHRHVRAGERDAADGGPLLRSRARRRPAEPTAPCSLRLLVPFAVPVLALVRVRLVDQLRALPRPRARGRSATSISRSAGRRASIGGGSSASTSCRETSR